MGVNGIGRRLGRLEDLVVARAIERLAAAAGLDPRELRETAEAIAALRERGWGEAEIAAHPGGPPDDT